MLNGRRSIGTKYCHATDLGGPPGFFVAQGRTAGAQGFSVLVRAGPGGLRLPASVSPLVVRRLVLRR